MPLSIEVILSEWMSIGISLVFLTTIDAFKYVRA